MARVVIHITEEQANAELRTAELEKRDARFDNGWLRVMFWKAYRFAEIREALRSINITDPSVIPVLVGRLVGLAEGKGLNVAAMAEHYVEHTRWLTWSRELLKSALQQTDLGEIDPIDLRCAIKALVDKGTETKRAYDELAQQHHAARERQGEVQATVAEEELQRWRDWADRQVRYCQTDDERRRAIADRLNLD